MPAAARPRTLRTAPRGFALWALSMLLVVLLSAMPSEGEARTRLVGSAFDPTTVSVALSPKLPKAKVKAQPSERRRLPDLLADGPAVQFAPGFAMPAASAAAAAAASVAPGPVAAPLPAALARAHGPRAPPRA